MAKKNYRPIAQTHWKAIEKKERQTNNEWQCQRPIGQLPYQKQSDWINDQKNCKKPNEINE